MNPSLHLTHLSAAAAQSTQLVSTHFLHFLSSAVSGPFPSEQAVHFPAFLASAASGSHLSQFSPQAVQTVNSGVSPAFWTAGKNFGLHSLHPTLAGGVWSDLQFSKLLFGASWARVKTTRVEINKSFVVLDTIFLLTVKSVLYLIYLG